MTCTHCGDNLRLEYQARWTKRDGRWVDAGGFHIATCDNRDCRAHGITVTATKHAHIDLDKFKPLRSLGGAS